MTFMYQNHNKLLLCYFLHFDPFAWALKMKHMVLFICLFVFPFFHFLFLIRYFLHLHFQCYPKSPLYPPPTPLSTHSHFLALAFPCTEADKVCTNGPLFPRMAHQAIFCYICSQRHELWGGTRQFILLFHLQGCRSLQLLGYFLQLLHWGPCDPSNS